MEVNDFPGLLENSSSAFFPPRIDDLDIATDIHLPFTADTLGLFNNRLKASKAFNKVGLKIFNAVANL